MKVGTIWLLLCLATSGGGQEVDFSEFDYMKTEGAPYCPNALDLWYHRVPYGAGVSRCGKGVIDGPTLPPKPTPPATSTTTSTTAVSTIPGFQADFEASCCTTLPPTSTDLPEYTTAPPYEYAWQTDTGSRTTTATSTSITTVTTVTTMTKTSATITSTSTILPWYWNLTGNWTASSTSTTASTSTTLNETSTSTSTTASHTLTLTSTTNSTTTTATNTTTLTTTTASNTTTSFTVTKTTVTISTTFTHSSITMTTTTGTWLPNPSVPCKELCPRVTPTACRGKLDSDTTCETGMLGSPCFEQNDLVFSCPGTNRDPNRHQELISGHYGVKCWICSFDDSTYKDGMLPDVDMRSGHILVDLKFGPNMLGNAMDESPITGYAVFLADLDGNRYPGDAVLEFAKRFSSEELARISCCEEAAYTARVAAKLPEGVSQVRFEVVPVLIGLGPLAVGRISVPVEDAQPFNQVVTTSEAGGLSFHWLCGLAAAAVAFASRRL